MNLDLETLLRIVGAMQLCVLIASAQVPFQLNWKQELACLSKLHRQMYWVYAGYVVLSIVAFGLISLLNAGQLAGGDFLARSFCLYVAIFWGLRLPLQAVFDVKEHLTKWWLKLGYHTLTLMFVCFTLIYAYSALRPN
ncbi:hypothetical protein M4951_19900 [Blastopirellula sp. J2-11]|uniref:hypothetical protein n=1 Tax=Blastopirellula sp. J2-11 TaxID=2943192 RepID=UPI0021C701AA|nr:hypothetical protein [Blastopirellula sp. J2-11]UUO05626.1 hypothetical protein M4951_19900 [Blastopirellula sp. J2-11]